MYRFSWNSPINISKTHTKTESASTAISGEPGTYRKVKPCLHQIQAYDFIQNFLKAENFFSLHRTSGIYCRPGTYAALKISDSVDLFVWCSFLVWRKIYQRFNWVYSGIFRGNEYSRNQKYLNVWQDKKDTKRRRTSRIHKENFIFFFILVRHTPSRDTPRRVASDAVKTLYMDTWQTKRLRNESSKNGERKSFPVDLSHVLRKNEKRCAQMISSHRGRPNRDQMHILLASGLLQLWWQ